MRTNRARLVKVSVLGEISSPQLRSPYRVGFDGVARMLPATGGIAYNVRVGDPALGWVGDHVEPGVSIKLVKDELANAALNTLACVGNEAQVVSGDARGERGSVTGKHGGIEHVLVDFPPSALERMAIGDKIQIRAWGQGLAIDDAPAIRVMNLDPDLFERLGLTIVDGALQVPVVAEVPPELMGSGIGSPSSERGDYDITTQDRELLAEFGLLDLRLGDLVAVRDRSGQFGRSYRRGWLEIGVVVHSDSHLSGHGPGLTTLMTGERDHLVPVIDPQANLAGYLPHQAMHSPRAEPAGANGHPPQDGQA
ncbi:MAG TPA: DUF4438 domain-containing protein [Bacillota bacterium]|nr:DUF4438 domain-containing protein [Bacillota bacterium]